MLQFLTSFVCTSLYKKRKTSSWTPHYERVLLIDGLLLVYLIYIYQLGGNWEAVITQDAVQRFSTGATTLMSLEHRWKYVGNYYRPSRLFKHLTAESRDG